MVITFDNVSFTYTDKKILDKASFSMTDKDKIGVVGVNGSGKTTILKLIMGLEKPQGGEIIKSGGMIINYLEQDPKFDNNKTILEIVMEGSTKEHEIKEFEAKSFLSKMGFLDYDAKPSNFSGGELKRLALAKVLVSYSDFLILDEPTNHLDTDLIIFLEKYLMKYKKGLLMVTHDRYFLERVTDKMLELDFAKTYMYDANYEKFLELKEERISLEEASKRKIKSILKKETEWIHRGAEARSTKQKGRINRYNELSKIEFNDRSETIKLDSVTTRLGKKLIEMKNGSKSFGDNLLFKDFSFSIQKTDRIGVVGKNGSGKTTFFKILMGLENLTSGELIKGETLRIGYFSQHLELIDDNIRIIDYIEENQKLIETNDGVITSAELLENFLFDRSVHYTLVKTLSGGEKRRLQLIKVLSQNPNVLIFDEPTNDLDLYTLEILEDYLLSFKGPILTVSHDRYFLDKICNKLFIFDNKKISESNLMFSDYLENKLEESNKDEIKSDIKDNRKQNKLPTSIRNESNKLNEEIPKLENEIDKLKKELSLETIDYKKIMDLSNRIEELNKELDSKMERFLELEEIKEQYNK